MNNRLLLKNLTEIITRLGTLLVTSATRTSAFSLSAATSTTTGTSRVAGWVGLLFLPLFLLAGTASAQIDLSLSKSISNANPAIGQTVTYRISVKNTGSENATNVVVRDSLPAGGAQYLSSTVVRGSGSFTAATGLWTVGLVTAGDSAILEIQAQVLAQGVFFNVAQVMSMTGLDVDSTPGDGALNQDDIAVSCFSVPLDWYAGDEFLVSVPSGYSGITWFYNGVPIVGSVVVNQQTLATVNQDLTLSIKGPGSFTFTSVVGSCPASGCCAIQVVQGAYGSIGEFVWNDVNQNGIQDGGEPGVQGVTVQLLNGDGNVIRTRTTNATGNYLFDSLMSGTYSVKFLAPAGQTFTLANQGGNPALDSDAGPGGTTGTITIDTSQPANSTLRNNLTISAGLIATPVFDLAFNKALSPGQAGTVTAGSTVSFTLTVTNEGNVAATQIMLSDSLPAGMVLQDANWTMNGGVAMLTTPIASLAIGETVSRTITVQISPSFLQGSLTNYAQINAARDANGNIITDRDSSPGNGFYRLEDDTDTQLINVTSVVVADYGSIGNIVWNDDNNNGIRDNGETGVAGVTLSLYACSGQQVLATAITDASGMYMFDNLASGTYQVGISKPTGSVFSAVRVGQDPLLNSAFGTNGRSHCITIDVTQSEGDSLRNNQTINAGLVRFGSIGDFVWRDTNNNGVQDAGEPGVAGVTVQLLNASMTPIRTTFTNANGIYKFDTLFTGEYYVKVVAPSGDLFAQQTQGGDPTKDSNVDPNTGISGAINLNATLAFNDANRTITGIDAGLRGIAECPTILLTVTGNQTPICAGESLGVTVTSSVAGSTIHWFASPTDTISLFSTPSGQLRTLNPTVTTNYYVEAVTTLGCRSATRTLVTITVNPKPATPTVAGNLQNTCPAVIVSLTSITPTPSTVNGTMEWRVGPTSTSALVPNPAQVTTGTYYLFEKSALGCYSTAAPVTVNIISCNCQLDFTVYAGLDQEVCPGEPINVTAALTGVATSVTWTSSGTGTFSSAGSLTTGYQPSPEDMNAGFVVLTATTNDPDALGECTPKTDAVTITITPRPAPAFGVACDDTLLCQGKSTKLIGFAPFMTINWYTQAVGGTPIGTTVSGGKLTVSPTTTTTYYAETVSETGCIGERTPITVAVETCYSDLQVVKSIITPGPYSPGQSITYAITVKNMGPGNAKNVTVQDVLPATLTYASSIPAGEYNNTTGVWTLGEMTNTSSRTLILNAAIKANASGSIKNLATVLSPDNDPSKAANDTSSVTIHVGAQADLMLVKTVSKPNPAQNEVVTYTLQVVNAGPQIATNVEVSDLLPAGLEFVSSATMTRTGNTLKGTIPTIGVNQTQTLSFTARVTGSGTITNVAQLSISGQGDPDSTPGNGYNNGEDDESSVSVTVGCPNLEAPIIACANTNVCVGTSVTFTAVGCKDGTVQWSNGMTGASIVVVMNQTTTFTAVCKKDDCLSAASNSITINVNNPIKPVLASNVSSVCIGGSATLTAANCTGAIIWSNGATGSPLTVTPSATTTYTAYCKIGTCESERESVTITVTPPAAAPVITCGKMEICPGESVTLTAHECAGVVQWSNGTVGTSITVSPMATTSYSARCVVNGCSSEESELHEIKVVTPTPPLIAANKTTVCPGAPATLTASNCTGTVVWSTGATGATLIVTPNATQSYTATCKLEACSSTESNVVTIAVSTPVAPIISANKTVICSGDSVNLTAIGCNGLVTWSNGMTGASIMVKPGTSTDYTATCTVNACASASSNSVRINVNTAGQPPVIASSKSTICVGESVTISATGCTGAVSWSNGMTGASITVQPTTNTSYTAVCLGTAGTCASGASNQVTINVGQSTTPVIVASKSTICAGETVTLTASGCTSTLTWSNGMTGASIQVSPTANTTYSAICGANTACASTPGTVAISVASPAAPTVICSKDTICAGESLTLLIQGCAGTAQWSNGQSGEAIVVSPLVTTTYTARCVVNGCESPVSPNYTIAVVSPVKPTLTASATTIPAGSPVTISAAGCVGGQVQWTNGALGNSITVSPAATTTYGAVCIMQGCQSEAATIAINVTVCNTPAPVILASSPTVCRTGSVTLTASNCAGQVAWSNGMTGNSINVPMNATTTFTAVCTVDNCPSPASNAVTVSVTDLNAPTIAASSTSICAGDSVTLTAIGCNGNVMWSNGMTGSSIKVSPATTTSYTATCQLGTCTSVASAPTTITVGTPTAPVIQASTNSVCFGSTVTLTASGCNGYVIWSNGLVGNSITIAPALTSTFTAVCCTSDYCKSQPSNAVTVAVAQKVAKPVTRSLSNACPLITVDLTTGTTSAPRSVGGSFVYRMGNTPESAAVNNPAAVGAGTYYVFEKTTAGCYSEPSQIVVTINNCSTLAIPCLTNPATASAGADATICAALSYKLSGSIGGAASSAVWTSNGTGTFDNPNSLTATYFPSASDLLSGQVQLTLTTNDPDGAGTCPAGSATMQLTIQSISTQPGLAVNGVAKTDTLPTYLNICAGDSVVLTALNSQDSNGNPYLYKWNGAAASASNRFAVKQSGTYTVALANANGCISMNSPQVIVNVYDAVPTPVVVNRRNTCPATTVDLATAVMSTVLPGGTFEYHIGASPTSAWITTPQAVGAGSYYVFQKSATGCYSAPARIDVQVINCAADTKRADVIIAKQVDRINVQTGENVTYTFKLKNLGPDTATQVAMVDVLPAGLGFVNGGGFEVEGNIVKAVVPSLAPNDSISLSFTALVSGGGSITNTARIEGGDQIDPVLTNNTSSVTILAAPNGDVQNMLGVAKLVGTPVEVENGIFDVSYTIMLANLGANDLTNVQVKDDLSAAFGNGAVLVPGGISLSASPGLTVNPEYTGQGASTNMLLAAQSALPVGANRDIFLTVRVNVSAATTTQFFNTAIGSAQGQGGVMVADTSTSGTSADPDNDLNPGNNSTPTPIDLNNIPTLSKIGAALAVSDTLRQSDGSLNITYKVVLKNYGSQDLTSVQVTDSLTTVFNSLNGATFRKVGTPIASRAGNLTINSNFDGVNDMKLLVAANSTLTAGNADTLTFTINVSTDGRQVPYFNQVHVSAKAGDVTVTDVSTSGMIPDLNANGDPTEATESEPTPIMIPLGTHVFIPEGFSPNGDGINDLFVIRNTDGKAVMLEVYNRWMMLVYKNDDYKNDWNGTPNTGIRVSNGTQGLPDGTYYYVVKLSDGRRYVRYMTITR